jgi:hypothetical protein
MTKFIVRAKAASSGRMRLIRYAIFGMAMGLFLYLHLPRTNLNLHGFHWVGEPYSILLLSGLVAILVWLIGASALRRNNDKECEVSLSPAGVQLSSRQQPFLLRERLTDLRVVEVMLAHRVFSTLRVYYYSTDESTIESMEVFSGVELTYAECVQARQKLLQELALPSVNERHEKD